MSAVAALAPEISEPLTWAEICARYPDEWVCIVEMDQLHPNGFAFRAARVVGHGKTRRAPVDQAMAWRDRYELIGHFYTGRITARPPRPSWSSMTRLETQFEPDDDGVVAPNVLVHVFDLGHDDIDGLVGLSFLNQLNYEIRSLERRILVEHIAPAAG